MSFGKYYLNVHVEIFCLDTVTMSYESLVKGIAINNHFREKFFLLHLNNEKTGQIGYTCSIDNM